MYVCLNWLNDWNFSSPKIMPTHYKLIWSQCLINLLFPWIYLLYPHFTAFTYKLGLPSLPKASLQKDTTCIKQRHLLVNICTSKQRMKNQQLALQCKYFSFHIIMETVQFTNHSFLTENLVAVKIFVPFQNISILINSKDPNTM